MSMNKRLRLICKITLLLIFIINLNCSWNNLNHDNPIDPLYNPYQGTDISPISFSEGIKCVSIKDFSNDVFNDNLNSFSIDVWIYPLPTTDGKSPIISNEDTSNGFSLKEETRRLQICEEFGIFKYQIDARDANLAGIIDDCKKIPGFKQNYTVEEAQSDIMTYAFAKFDKEYEEKKDVNKMRILLQKVNDGTITPEEDEELKQLMSDYSSK